MKDAGCSERADRPVSATDYMGGRFAGVLMCRKTYIVVHIQAEEVVTMTLATS